MPIKQFDELLAAAGWTFDRLTGSGGAHRLYRDQYGHVLTVACGHGHRKIKHNQVGWVRQFLRRSDHQPGSIG